MARYGRFEGEQLVEVFKEEPIFTPELMKQVKKIKNAEYKAFLEPQEGVVVELSYVEKRQIAFAEKLPVGDQLDAILKFLTSERFKGENLPEELDAVIGQWTAIKRDNPKPEEGK